MPTVVTTAKANNANAYANVSEADAYHETRLHVDDWTSANTATKEAALIDATRLLDALYAWEGIPTSDTQALAWPRDGVLDKHCVNNLDPDTIPQLLKEVTAEFARQLITADRAADDDSAKLTSLSAGPVSMSFRDGVSKKVVPDAVRDLIPRHWGYRFGRNSRSVIRG
jgi:hypothetical protein